MFCKRSISLAVAAMIVADGSCNLSAATRSPVVGFDQASNPNITASQIPNMRKTTVGKGNKMFSANAVIALADQNTPPSVNCPADKAGLTDGFDQYVSSVTKDAAASLSLFAKADINANDKVILYYFMWHKDYVDNEGNILYTCGAGVKLALKVTNIQASANLSLPMIAASAQLGDSSVEYRLGTFGLSGAAIDAAIPDATKVGKFDADAYAEFMASLSKIQTAWKDGANLVVTPRVVQVGDPGPTPGVDIAALIRTYAIGQIAQGVRCRAAQSSVPDRNDTTDGQVQEIYQTVGGGTGCGVFSGGPSADAKTAAAAELAKYHLSVH